MREYYGSDKKKREEAKRKKREEKRIKRLNKKAENSPSALPDPSSTSPEQGGSLTSPESELQS